MTVVPRRMAGEYHFMFVNPRCLGCARHFASPSRSMLNRDRNLTFRSLIGVAIGIIALAIVAIAMTVWALRSDAAQDAARENGNIATILAEETARSVQSIELVAVELQERIAALGGTTPNRFREALDNEDTYRMLVDRLARLPQASVITLIESNGRYWNTTRGWPRPDISLADQEPYLHFKANPTDPNLFVSVPVQNRITGSWTTYFTKGIASPSGEFVGVVVVGVELRHFRRIYDSLISLRDQAYTFLRDDGTVLVRHPDVGTKGLKVPASSPWYGLVAQGGGTYRSAGDFDSTPRLVTVRPVRDYPLVIDVGVSEAAAFANWERRAIFIGVATLLTLICSIFLLKALTSQFRRLVKSERSVVERETRLAEKSCELERANEQIDAALNNITQGLCMFDKDTRIVVFNNRYIEMYGLSREVVKPGCTLRRLIEHRKEVGLFKGDPEQYCEEIVANMRQGKTSIQLIETTDGRSIYAVNQPIANGGWVVTHDDITERRRAEQQMIYMARHDALTGLANRVLLLERMEEALARLRRRGEAFTIFVFDLDLFKSVNDSLGHPIGDALLKAVAQRLRACTRETDTVARLGGDEFALLQAVEGDQREGAIILANRLLEAVSAPYEIEGHQVIIGTSIGIVLAPSDGLDTDQLLKNADLALYRAKSEGRNGYRLFELEMDSEARSRHALQVDLRIAVTRGEFELHYQTVLDATTRRVCGAEALVRWRHAQFGLIQPSQFIQLAEEIGMIIPLGDWILRRACADAARWPSAYQARRQSVAGAVQEPQPRRHRHRRAGEFRAAAGAVGAGSHRICAAAQELGQPCAAASAQEPRHFDRARRLRHRLFVTQLFAHVPVRQDQNRPFVRRRIVEPRRLRGDRLRGDWPRPGAQHPHHCGRR